MRDLILEELKTVSGGFHMEGAGEPQGDPIEGPSDDISGQQTEGPFVATPGEAQNWGKGGNSI